VDHIIQRSEFLTSYTPYQPEITQGTLQYLFEFQTQVANLTAMEVANASMYDGSTGTGEAVLMAHRVTKRRKAVLSGGLHPQYRETVETLPHGRRAVVALPRRHGTGDILAQIDDRSPASSCRARFVRQPATCSRSPRRRTSTARAHRVSRGGVPRARAPRAEGATSSSARASRSATR
jgi:glycine cleavage system pyridoxal-binding protein P